MDRRKFLTYVGCSCCGFVFNGCSTAPITQRRQLKIIPEAKLTINGDKLSVVEEILGDHPSDIFKKFKYTSLSEGISNTINFY